MSFTRIIRDLSVRALAVLDLVGTRFRQSNHVWRRGKGKGISTIVLGVFGLIVLGLIIGVAHKSNEDLDFLDYDGGAPGVDYAYEDLGGDASYEPPADEEVGRKPDDPQVSEATKKAFKEVLDAIQANSPEGQLQVSKGSECNLMDIGVTDTSKFDRLTKESLEKCLQIPEEMTKTLHEAHKKFRAAIGEKLMPMFRKLDTPAFSGDGILIVGGGKYSVFALPAIKAIRENSGFKLKSSIPIEIIIPPSDKADRGFCDNVLPKVDPLGLTKCVFLDEMFDADTLSHIEGYQIKALALLVSRFERVLMLDADNYVVNSINDYFTSSALNDKGLILWPDYWRRLHHPKLYGIVDLGVSPDHISRYSVDDVSPDYMYKKSVTDTPFHDFRDALPDGGTESGQLLVDKKKHLDSIIMSLYYNYNGKSYYYPILGQGFAGEGDKDTFALASRVMHGPGSFYQVKTPVDTLGHWADAKDEIRLLEEEYENVEKKFRGCAMLQHDYIEDSKFSSLAREVLGNTIRNNEEKFCDEWAAKNKGKFSAEEKARREECKKSKEVQDALHEKMRASYKLDDYLAFFSFTGVSFVHSHLPKYDPWEWYENGDMMFDGKKAKKNHKNDPDYVPAHSGNYRMYDSKFNQISSYDLELANWSAFKSYLCDLEGGYKNFGYLSNKIDSTKSPKQSNKDMCKYIEERVEYLKSTSWNDYDV
ncbi:alpha-mannosyltransferase [Lachancea thermotolerans CBS 6340]|uniref:KLTH0C08976p n=1 Tax=Lachancea thermotolerans (strain ATCC 56472 / CBS 6340 / NRRL Y-8284) TaxID=559295 RepID=C5DEG5_LACTC|nr:KLTH0C08976p [Lachancea thermotolerans CBS 6340]CAR22176.1 KLTH0C08976p [Lachancea thermotolerans CBS 6340]